MGQEKAIVLGLYGINALGTVRSLGREGVPVIGIHNNSRYPHAMSSRYLVESHDYRGEEGILETLVEVGKRQDRRATIFCTGDDAVLLCAHHRTDLESYFHVPHSTKYPLETLMNKHDILAIARESGFLIPESIFLSLDDALKRLKYPVIIKPLGIDHAGKSNIFFAADSNELERQRKDLLAHYGDMVVEEFIPNGIEDNFEVHGCSLQGRTVIAGMLQKLKYYSLGEIPIGCHSQSVFVPELVEPTDNFVRKVMFSGPLDLNFIRRQGTQDFYFLEANYRPSANLMIDTIGGVNLPALVHYKLVGDLGRAEQLASTKLRSGVKWIDEGKVLQGLWEGRNTLGEYVFPLLDERAFSFFDLKDPRPFLQALLTGNILFKPKKVGE